MTDRDTDVLIVGAGPAGLMLACELRLAGVSTTLVERDRQRPRHPRGFNLNARSLDLLARRGLADMFVAEGWRAPHAPSPGLPVELPLAGTTTGHPFTLGIPQNRVEELLEDHALAAGAELLRGHRLHTVEQDDTTVTAALTADGGERTIRAAYAVGCDGGRSTVRKIAGIAFPGTAATSHSLLGDVVLADPDALPFGVSTGPGGSVFAIPRPGYVRLITEDPHPPADRHAPVTLDRLQAAVDDALGRHVALTDPLWLTRFGDAARQAARYRSGRILLAGDAAHIHPPAGAIGLNIALDDAVNLGWKLAAVVHGTMPDPLLDTYHDERHPAGADVLAATRAQIILGRPDPALDPLKDLLTRLLTRPEANRALTETLTGLDTRYDVGAAAPEAHPWLGRLVPDLNLHTSAGAIRLSAALAAGRPVLLGLTAASDRGLAAAARSYDVAVIDARCPDHPGAGAVLVRPDGHAAWVRTTAGDASGDLDTALRRWCARRIRSDAGGR
ncbi:2-polyprenyl-6-methoxyphenol hydroxylase-like FAD-dependent oxidoreductase [Nocardiopsis mwathae]|uniref:2-polyprenyl-6-methoxyphenol hydroxylase-like FAD-dependent oxidoreductase n=1 Tax=Nocardiopsis mwathae TaxID=1472723 RepID=A0A7X0D4X1_9ACTN|nr:FAD-dependent monooxygenase [Nocardiopsis mwathae]MBB6171633.1 2-polyprenyl-6-methoxyphenol hydroxylase-like FAD-dependent oxidoreductase [Nocardiopsis mwathae]